MKLSKDKYITNLYFDQDEVQKARLMHGNPKTIKKWYETFGADIIVNASLFDWKTGIPIETFKHDGVVFGKSDWVKHGFGICTDQKTILFSDFNDNFLDYTCGFPTLIWEGMKQDNILYKTVQGVEPRTIFSKGEDGFCITTIDGRRPEQGKHGMSLDDATNYLHKKGMWFSCNLDGGDSTCLAVNGEIVNSPSGTRSVPCVLAIWLKKDSDGLIKEYSIKANGNDKLSTNFKVKEFRCKDGSESVLIDGKLVDILQSIRNYFGKPVTINSAYRNATYNRKVGGASGSLHVKGMAADIVVSGVAPAEVANYAERIGVKGIGLYETAKDGYFVHVDTRTSKSFWYGQAQAYRETFGGIKAEYGLIADELEKHISIADKQGLVLEMQEKPNGRLYWMCKKFVEYLKGDK